MAVLMSHFLPVFTDFLISIYVACLLWDWFMAILKKQSISYLLLVPALVWWILELSLHSQRVLLSHLAFSPSLTQFLSPSFLCTSPVLLC